jgi:hypothetical protein
MSAFRAVPGLRASLAAALGLTSAACGGDLILGAVQDASIGDSTPGDSMPGTSHHACINPVPILVSGKDTGYEHLRDRDPAVAAVLATIAADEARDAELAWRSVAWMVSVFGRAARDALADALADARRAALADETPRSPGVGEQETGDRTGLLLERGLLAESARAAIRDEALRSVVVPLAKALLDGRGEDRTLPPELRS